mmetsp:Transcript_31148/g.37017  ORF Transcript_31148/g.37017 Transcript_31148/m.37017 type:complete len:123 (-) Transcript_31148:14-382(-)
MLLLLLLLGLYLLLFRENRSHRLWTKASRPGENSDGGDDAACSTAAAGSAAAAVEYCNADDGECLSFDILMNNNASCVAHHCILTLTADSNRSGRNSSSFFRDEDNRRTHCKGDFSIAKCDD